jgi:uncharacterized protein
MNQSFLLYRLQKIDNQLDKNTSRLEEINRLLTADDKILNSQNKSNMALKLKQDSLRAQKYIEDQVETYRIKIETNEASLYSGRILNPKELRDLQTEVSSLKRRFSTLEDELLDAMVIFEDADTKFQDSVLDLNAAQKEFETSPWIW